MTTANSTAKKTANTKTANKSAAKTTARTKTQPAQPDNLRIWEEVKTTDADAKKPFSVGGFNGTQIQPTYLAHRATKVFGPMGIGWGRDIVKEDYRQGAPKYTNGELAGHEITHFLTIKFWYVDPSTGERGEFEEYGSTLYVFWQRTYQEFKTDGEATKKSMTDATGKALSRLGFSADVYGGDWSDSKYSALPAPDAPQTQPRQRQTAGPSEAKVAGDIGSFNWERLKQVTGLDSGGITRIAKDMGFPAKPSECSRIQLATIRLAMLLEWAESKGAPIAEISEALGSKHQNMTDANLITSVRDFGQQPITAQN